MSENESAGEKSERPQSLHSDDFDEFLEETLCPCSEPVTRPMEACPHPGYLAGMCIRCGADKPDDEADGSLLPFKYVHQGLELSREEAQRLSEQRTADAEARGKLQLVLDLDHTLVNSAPIDPWMDHPYLRLWMEAETQAEQENAAWRRTLHIVPSCKSVTKLRPGVFQFLKSLEPLYEMHIYTMGEESYASEMAKLLDPDNSIFRGKVISREHSSAPMAKSLDIVIGSDRSTVIVDDTWQVWTHHTKNLLSVSKYLFFPSLPGHGNWLEMHADESSSTGELHNIQQTLQRIHTAYFAAARDERDVRLVIKSLFRRKRLRSDG